MAVVVVVVVVVAVAVAEQLLRRAAENKRLRFAVFNLPVRLVSHGRRLWARVARSLLEHADLLLGRARRRAAWAA